MKINEIVGSFYELFRLIRRLKLRNIHADLPKFILKEFDVKYIERETDNIVYVKKVKYLNKIRDMMIVCTEDQDRIRIITIHPLKKYQKENRINSGRWEKI